MTMLRVSDVREYLIKNTCPALITFYKDVFELGSGIYLCLDSVSIYSYKMDIETALQNKDFIQKIKELLSCECIPVIATAEDFVLLLSNPPIKQPHNVKSYGSVPIYIVPRSPGTVLIIPAE